MPDYTVNWDFKHDGKSYKQGDSVKLSEAEAKPLLNGVLSKKVLTAEEAKKAEEAAKLKALAEKEPEKKATTKKEG